MLFINFLKLVLFFLFAKARRIRGFQAFSKLFCIYKTQVLFRCCSWLKKFFRFFFGSLFEACLRVFKELQLRRGQNYSCYRQHQVNIDQRGLTVDYWPFLLCNCKQLSLLLVCALVVVSLKPFAGVCWRRILNESLKSFKFFIRCVKINLR